MLHLPSSQQITRRYAEFSAALVCINSSHPNDMVRGFPSLQEPVNTNYQRPTNQSCYQMFFLPGFAHCVYTMYSKPNNAQKWSKTTIWDPQIRSCYQDLLVTYMYTTAYSQTNCVRKLFCVKLFLLYNLYCFFHVLGCITILPPVHVSVPLIPYPWFNGRYPFLPRF